MRMMAKVLLISASVAVSAMVSQPAAASSMGFSLAPASFGDYVRFVMTVLSGHAAAGKISGEAQSRH